jgi:hypothetical protein
MRKIREILTHRYTHGLSLEKTALAVRKSKGCVYSTCAHFKASGLSWPLPPDITDEQIILITSIHLEQFSSCQPYQVSK